MLFETIRNLANSRKVSLSKVEEDLGFSRNYLYNLKRNKPNPDVLVSLANYFNVTTDYLLGRTNEDNLKGMYRLNTENLNEKQIEELKSEMARLEEMVLAKLMMNNKKGE